MKIPIVALVAALCTVPVLAFGVGVEIGIGTIGSQEAAEAAAEGTFDVEARQVDEESFPDDTALGRYSLVKRYHGDLEGTGNGTMLTAATPIETSAAYVAMERFDGTLDGRRGTFILQHLGTMTRAGQSLTITVVPDSGTGELAGLEGTLLVEITDGEHFYDFEYTLPDRTATARDPGRRPRARRPRHGSDGCRTPPSPTRDPVRRHQRDETEEAR